MHLHPQIQIPNSFPANKWSVLFKESQFVHHFTHQEMRSEIDVEIVKIRGIIYQQNLGMDFESRVADSYEG